MHARAPRSTIECTGTAYAIGNRAIGHHAIGHDTSSDHTNIADDLDHLLTLPISGDLIAAVSAITVDRVTDASARLTLLRIWERITNWAEAESLRMTDAFAAACNDEPGAVAGESTAEVEVGWVRGGNSWTGAGRIDLARGLAPGGPFPRTAALVATGHLPVRYARLLVDEAGRLTREQCFALEARVLPRVERRLDPTTGTGLLPTWRSWRDAIHRAVMRIDPERAARERREAESHRGAWLRRHRDGTATIGCTMPVVDAAGVWQTLNVVAERIREGDGEQPRTLDQARADAFSATFADVLERCQATGQIPLLQGRTRVEVQVVIDLPTLLGLADNPADVPGFGSIDPALARILASDAEWRRLVRDPLTADLLDVGRTRYTPGQLLRDFVLTRHPRCTMPGCTRRSWHAQLDHITPWPAGPTTRDNLHPVCQRDHNRKTLERWRVDRLPGGRVRWHSPHGLRNDDEPAWSDDADPARNDPARSVSTPIDDPPPF
jgi:hypothetical protein